MKVSGKTACPMAKDLPSILTGHICKEILLKDKSKILRDCLFSPTEQLIKATSKIQLSAGMAS
jgi:hypothetical protein